MNDRRHGEQDDENEKQDASDFYRKRGKAAQAEQGRKHRENQKHEYPVKHDGLTFLQPVTTPTNTCPLGSGKYYFDAG